MNIELLKAKIQEINVPITTIADKMGVSRQTLYLKLQGKRCFKMSEANKISDILRLTNAERTTIFLSEEVDKTIN